MSAAALSERQACRFTGFARSTHRYRPTRNDARLRVQLEMLAILKPRWGYRRLHWRLRRDGELVNRKRVQRVYREAGLQVRRRRRKRVSVARVPLAIPREPNARWSMDFVYDRLGDGRALRVFTLVDDFTRASPGLLFDVAIGAERLTAFLDALGVLPTALVCDNGPEFTSRHFDQWAHTRGIHLQFMRPGKPVENAFIESSNGKFRDECLNESWFATLADARQQIEAWRVEYNVARTAASPIEPRRSLPRASSPLHLHLPTPTIGTNNRTKNGGQGRWLAGNTSG